MRVIALISIAFVTCWLFGCDVSQLDRWAGMSSAEVQSQGPPDNRPPDRDDDDEDDGNEDDEDGNPCECEDEDEVCSQGGRCLDVTGSTSVTDELQQDLDELPEAEGMGVPYELPANAVLRIDDEDGDGIGLRIDEGVLFEGNGARLVAENGIVAMRLENGASWSSVKNLFFDVQDRGEVHDGIGIDVRAHGLRLENMRFDRFGTGIRAHTESDELDYANVNTQQWSRLIFRNSHHYALHVKSGDANAGLYSGIEVLGGGGIKDESFLGNTYVAPVIQETEGTSLHLGPEDADRGGAQSTTVLGMYVEGDSPDPTTHSNNDLHLGGNAIDRLQSNPDVVQGGDRIGGRRSRVRFGEPGGVTMQIPRSDDIAFAVGHPAEQDEPGVDAREWRFQYNETNEWWEMFSITVDDDGTVFSDRSYYWTEGLFGYDETFE